MNVNLHIETLVIHTLPSGVYRVDEFQSALRSDLTRMLAEHGVDAAHAPLISTDKIGGAIAEAVFSAIGPPQRGERL